MKKIYIAILAAMTLLPMTMQAQALKGSYFMENSVMRHKLNPAFTPQSNYVSIPAIGNLGVGVMSNVGISNFLFPKDGKLYTYLNNQVSFEEFDKKLAANPYLNLDVNTDIIDLGIHFGKHSFITVQAGVNLDVQMQLSRELFTLSKLGMASSSSTYTLNDFNIYQSAGIYLGAGYSYDFKDLVPGLKAGIKGRFIAGADYVGLEMGQSQISMSEDEWKVKSDATGTIAAPFMHVDLSQGIENTQVTTDMSKLAPSGYGFSVDLGVEYRLSVGSIVDGLTFSFAALDLGAINFGKKNIQTLKSAGEASFAGFDGISLDDYDFEAHAQEITDQFMELANFKEVETDKALVVSAQPKLLFGVEMPFVHDMMSVGLLYSNKFAYSGDMHELTLSYNLTPTKWFNFGLNYSMLNTFKSIGWVLEFAPINGVDFFIGSDYTYLEFTPQMLPVDKFMANVRFGLSATFGGRRNR